MANYVDSQAQISIVLQAQGAAVLTNYAVVPASAPLGGIVSINVTLTNNGSTDTLWVKYYVNGTELPASAWEASVTGGSPVVLPVRQFSMPNQNASVNVAFGHKVGANYVQDPGSPSTALMVTLLQYAHGNVITNSVWYDPGQSVETGTTVYIHYQAQNDGPVAGIIWGELQDSNENPVAGTQWQSSGVVSPGGIVDAVVSFVATAAFTGYVAAGHIE